MLLAVAMLADALPICHKSWKACHVHGWWCIRCAHAAAVTDTLCHCMAMLAVVALTCSCACLSPESRLLLQLKHRHTVLRCRL